MPKIDLGRVIGKDFVYDDFTQAQLEALKVKGDAGDNKVIVVKDGVQTREDLTLKKEGKFTTLLTGDTQETHKLLVDDVLDEDGNPIMDMVKQFSNPNLLINGDFQVWQRGETFSNINEKYTADRWLMTTTGTCSRISGKLNINSASGWCSIKQLVETNVNMIKNIVGKPVTLTYKVNCSTDLSGLTCQIGNETGKKVLELKKGENIIRLEKVITEDDINLEKNSLYINLFYGSVGKLDITVEWTKLELGTITTPFVPRLYAEELALCKRYYEVLQARTNKNYLYPKTEGQIGTSLTHITKRASPTIVVSDGNGNSGKCMRFAANNASFPNQPCRVSSSLHDFIEVLSDSGTAANGISAILYLDAEIY